MTDQINHHDDNLDLEEVEFSTTDDEGLEENSQAKIKKLRDDLKQANTEKIEYLSGWQRAKADYINLQNTEDKNRTDIIKYAKEGLLVDLLPLVDSFDMAFANKAVWEQAPENWRKGIEYIYSQLSGILKDNGLEPVVPPFGSDFDPQRHESIGLTATDKEKEDGKILEVVKKGYILQGKLIRPAQVKTGEFK